MVVNQVSLFSLSFELVIALHLSDHLGDFAGTHPKVDSDWNVHLIGDKHFYNSVKFADYLLCMIVSRLSLDETQTSERFLQRNSYYDDSFTDKQMEFLSKFFTNEPVCVYFGEGAVGEFIPKLNPSIILAVYYDKWF